METEIVSEVVSNVSPITLAETTTPVTVPVNPVDAGITGTTEETSDRRFGTRKTENADGSVSYGLKSDGTPRKRPGRKPKSSS